VSKNRALAPPGPYTSEGCTIAAFSGSTRSASSAAFLLDW
jgi:hypothetical protein